MIDLLDGIQAPMGIVMPSKALVGLEHGGKNVSAEHCGKLPKQHLVSGFGIFSGKLWLVSSGNDYIFK